MAPEYVTVYQISERSTDWLFALAGVAPLIVGVVIIAGKRRFHWKRPHWLMPVFACGFGFLWLCTAGVSVLHEDFQAIAAYRRGDYQIVEGKVTDFQPMPYEGHTDECFSVRDKRFCYSDYEIAPGFRNTASHGGPIRTGLQVRIAYSGDTILRLEVPKGQALSPAESTAVLDAAQNNWKTRMENDPIARRMNIAFLFTAACWTLWWNLQWKLVMRIWVRPPNPLWVQYLFRIFFALNFMGALGELVRRLYVHPLAKQDVGPTIEIAVAMCTVVALMSAFVLWMAQRRNGKEKEKATTP